MYTLGNFPSTAPEWIVNEFRKLQEALNAAVDGVTLIPLSAPPKKLTKGRIVLADGVNWDPLALALGGEYAVSYLRGAWRRLDI